MNTEELKALIEAIKTVSGTAQDVFIWWFALGIVRDVLWAGVILTIATLIYKAVLTGIIQDGTILNKQMIKIGAALGQPCGDIEYQTIYWSEYDKMLARIARLQRVADQAAELYKEKNELIGRMSETLNRIDNRMEFTQ